MVTIQKEAKFVLALGNISLNIFFILCSLPFYLVFCGIRSWDWDHRCLQAAMCVLGLNAVPLEGQLVLLTTELSPQPQGYVVLGFLVILRNVFMSPNSPNHAWSGRDFSPAGLWVWRQSYPRLKWQEPLSEHAHCSCCFLRVAAKRALYLLQHHFTLSDPNVAIWSPFGP